MVRFSLSILALGPAPGTEVRNTVSTAYAHSPSSSLGPAPSAQKAARQAQSARKILVRIHELSAVEFILLDEAIAVRRL